VAVIVPTEITVEDWRGRGILNLERSESAKNEILRNLHERAEQCNLRGYERILDIILEPVPFTEENGLAGPLRQPHLSALRSKYEARLLELYNT
jgi:long-subunit acyl-CoA synthetase (AMP-forming)